VFSKPGSKKKKLKHYSQFSIDFLFTNAPFRFLKDGSIKEKKEENMIKFIFFIFLPNENIDFVCLY
jgi:hypothetical protein